MKFAVSFLVAFLVLACHSYGPVKEIAQKSDPEIATCKKMITDSGIDDQFVNIFAAVMAKESSCSERVNPITVYTAIVIDDGENLIFSSPFGITTTVPTGYSEVTINRARWVNETK